TADNQTAILDAVRAAAGQLAPVTGDAFAVSVFNPGDDDRETCIVLGVGGDDVDQAHTSVTDAIDATGVDGLPDELSPWVAHVTLVYTDDPDQVGELVDRTGPILFDRLRVAFAGTATDIPLTGDSPVAAARKDPISMPNPRP